MEGLPDKYEKYLPYLEDLRKRVYKGFIIFAFFFIIGFFQTSNILRLIIKVFDIDGVMIATTSPFQFTDIATDVGFFLAIIICIPYFIYSLYAFILPALTKREKKIFYFSIPLCVLLFTVGFSYGFFILFYTLQFLADLNTSIGIKNVWNVSEFIMQIFVTSSVLGLFFEFPVVISLLIKTKLVPLKLIKDKRRLAYFLIFCLVALLPPTDGISLIVISLPLILLYEVTILVNYKHNIKQII